MEQVSVEDLSKSFDRNTVIRGLNLEIQAGEFLSLLGPSGCGKTTTLRCLAGLEIPNTGRISIGNDTMVDIAGGRCVPPNKRNIGMVFQSYALWPNMSVRSNISYPLRLRKTPRRQTGERVREVLAAVSMEEYADRYPHELSGGQQQRVALARGLVSSTGLMLFDEPLSNLDARLRIAMRSEIRRLHDKFGHTSVYVTHDQDEALAMSDRIVVMNDGHIEQVGTPGEIYRRPRTRFVARFVGVENLLRCEKVSEGPTGRVLHLEGGVVAPAVGPLADLAVGDTAAFRGSDARLTGENDDDRRLCRIRGRVLDSSYTGDGYRLGLETPGGSVTVHVPDSTVNPRQEKYLGELLEVGIPVECMLAL